MNPDCVPGAANCFVKVDTVSDTNPWFGTDNDTFATDNTENIYTMGRVGIGTTNPSVKLEVSGTIKAYPGIKIGRVGNTGSHFIYNGTLDELIFRSQDSNQTQASYTIFESAEPIIGGTSGGGVHFSNSTTAGTKHLTIRNSGNIGIGIINPSEKLHVTGNILASGSITPSDKKLKKDLIEIENALKKVNSINGYTYTQRDNGVRKAGVIAQEIEKILPEAVAEYDDFKAVHYDMLNAVLIEAIQELSIQNDELSVKNKELFSRLEKLEQK